ncbi:efflux RND transporter periplasmic adaptor subunit [Paracoccus sp. (in: a-proteobacteria)]|uniref:efflux RND transporter periplasmic adaptor subunit n=1 Tax=Paracoccus sp. TaxID=267 RepID=UPI003A8B1EFB
MALALAAPVAQADVAGQAAQVRSVPVRVQRLAIGDRFFVERQFPGQTEADQRSDLAFELGGYIRGISVDEGDEVTRGQVLALLDTDLLQAQQSELLASRAAIGARLDYAKLNLDRLQKLQNSGSSTVDRVDQALAERNELVARDAEVEAGLRQVNIRIDKARLIAPYDGFIGTRHLDEGDFAGAGMPVLTIHQAGAVRFRVGLPPDLDPAMFRQTGIELGGKVYPAMLGAIRPDLDPVTHMRIALFDITGDPPRNFGQTGVLRADTLLHVTGAMVPLDALLPGISDAWTVFTVDDNDIARSVLVEILHIGTDQAIVSGAFDDGDRVVTGGVHKLSNGQPVDPVD